MAYLTEESKYGPFPCESKPKVNAGKTKDSLNKRKWKLIPGYLYQPAEPAPIILDPP
jgi:hypothetical protein